MSDVMFPQFPQVSVESVGRDLTDVARGRKDGGVYKVRPPGPREEVLLLAFGRIVQHCREVH